jgi:hypothetical protein
LGHTYEYFDNYNFFGAEIEVEHCLDRFSGRTRAERKEIEHAARDWYYGRNAGGGWDDD